MNHHDYNTTRLVETTQAQTHAPSSSTEQTTQNIVETSTKRETTRTHSPHSPTHAPHSPTHAPHVPTTTPHISTEQHSTPPAPETTGSAETTQMNHHDYNTTRLVETTQTLTPPHSSPTEQAQTSSQHSEISTKGPITHLTHSPHRPTHEPHKSTTSYETTMSPVESTTGTNDSEQTSQSQINIEHSTKPESSTKAPGTHLTHTHETTRAPHHPTTEPFLTPGFEQTTNNLIPDPTIESTTPSLSSNTHSKDNLWHF